jgi:hypothetical protein
MSLAGRTLYHLWHAPLGKTRALLAAGLIDSFRTAVGQRAMEKAAHNLPLVRTSGGTPLQLHLLTGRRFWYQTAFCLWTFARHTGRPIDPVLYDDGTLDETSLHSLRRLFPTVRCVSQPQAIAHLDQHLPAQRYPTLRERWLNYPNLRKLIDPHLASSGWKLVVDSDLLFFREPRCLVKWLDDPQQPLHAVDCVTSYGYSPALMSELAGGPVPELVNVGLTGLDSAALDWDRLEFWCRTLIERERPHYYLEQALIAMLVTGQSCTVAPATDYITGPTPPEAVDCRAVMHHYVAQSKRWYFQRNWRLALAPSVDFRHD